MIPQLRDWYARYETKGLTIVGVHTPESLRAWPSAVTHIGEGGYAEMEQLIRSLLVEP